MVEGGKLIKRLEKWYYSLDRNICQGSLAQGEPRKKKLSEGVLVHQLAFSQEQSFKKTWFDTYVS